MKRALFMAAGMFAVALAVVAAAYAYSRPTELTVAVGPPTSEDAKLVHAVAQNLRRDRAAIRLRIVTVPGPAEAAAAFDDGKADLAVVRSDLATPAAGQLVAILHRNAAVLLAPGGSAISGVGDLRGKTVGVLRHSPVNDRLLETILQQYEVPGHEVARVTLDPDDVLPAVRDRRVDVVLAVGPVTGNLVPAVVAAVAAANGSAPVFLPIAEADAIAQRTTAYDSLQIVRGAFGGAPPKPSESVSTIAAVYRIVAQSKLADSLVTDFTRRLYEMRPDLAAAVPLAARIEAPDTEKGARITVHPGAAAYLDGDEETFLDRYGDWFYIIAMVVGGVASAGAAFAGRLRTRGHEQAQRLERLLGIMRKARTAESQKALDELEVQADEAFSETLALATREQIDTGRLATFSLALEQVRHAIAERRRVLPDRPADDRTPRTLTPLRAAGE
ncbi:TAXI family TRAP transporter solute-binding subunit [Alsobacter sp. KACC 23698]|uniref:TAXI family TRAP transporter solute-binding subunit n=2 Tax=Alsobacter sp. KACC 23698 TaxID=3149229 RepID=A0AAU7JG14_9HYPH